MGGLVVNSKPVLLVATMGAALLALTGCVSWGGPTADRIDAAVASVDFESVGTVFCDYRRPGQLGGAAPLRFIGIEDSEKGQEVIDLLMEAGYTTDGLSEDFSDGVISLFLDGVNVSLQARSKSEESMAFGNCKTPDGGAVTMVFSS